MYYVTLNFENIGPRRYRHNIIRNIMFRRYEICVQDRCVGIVYTHSGCNLCNNIHRLFSRFKTKVNVARRRSVRIINTLGEGMETKHHVARNNT